MTMTMEQARKLAAKAADVSSKFKLEWVDADDVTSGLVDDGVELPDAAAFYTVRRRRRDPEGGGLRVVRGACHREPGGRGRVGRRGVLTA